MPRVPEDRYDERVAVRRADASGWDIRENQHEEDRMRDIHVGKRGPEAAGEEQPDNLRKTVRFEQESLSEAATSDPNCCSLECGSQVMLMTTYIFLRWMHSPRWMDE